jgi:hypothetical protein
LVSSAGIHSAFRNPHSAFSLSPSTQIFNKNHNFAKAGGAPTELGGRNYVASSSPLNHELVLLTFGTFQNLGSNYYPQLLNWMELSWTWHV